MKDARHIHILKLPRKFHCQIKSISNRNEKYLVQHINAKTEDLFVRYFFKSSLSHKGKNYFHIISEWRIPIHLNKSNKFATTRDDFLSSSVKYLDFHCIGRWAGWMDDQKL